MTDAQNTAQPEPSIEKPEAREIKQRPKMTLEQQSAFLMNLLRRCTLHTGDMAGQFAGEAMVTLSEDDMLRLETIQQTIEIFDLHDAAKLVKDEIWRKKRARGK
jgi:phage FluMu protein gp41